MTTPSRDPSVGYPPAGYGPSYGSPPPGHLGWAITAVIFFWPLAIASFISYSKIESLWYRGDAIGAERASDATKRYGVIALCVGLALAVLWIALAVTLFGVSGATTHIRIGPGSP